MPTWSHNLIISLSVLGGVPAALWAQAEPKATALARQAVVQAYTGGMYDATIEVGANVAFQMMKSVLEASGQRLSQAQESELGKIIVDVFKEVTPQQVWVDAMVPLYAKTYSLEDLQRLVDLQTTPFGQRMIAAQAVMTREGARIGEGIMKEREALFSRRLGEEITKRMPDQ